MQTVLIVEDEIELRQNIAEELEDAGFDVVQAQDGVEGLQAVARVRPALVICDIMMPRLSGPDFYAKVRAEESGMSQLPFLFLSALSAGEGIAALPESERVNLLAKPIDFDDLVAAVRARLD